MEMATVFLPTDLKNKIEAQLEHWNMTWIEFLQDSVEQYEPLTAEMKEALDECEDILRNPTKYPSFHSVEELIADLESD